MTIGFRRPPNAKLNGTMHKTTQNEDEKVIEFIVSAVGKDKAWLKRKFEEESQPGPILSVGRWKVYSVLYGGCNSFTYNALKTEGIAPKGMVPFLPSHVRKCLKPDSAKAINKPTPGITWERGSKW